MKKVCIIFLLSIIISLTVVGFSNNLPAWGSKNANGEGRYALNCENHYLRMHIRADSNEKEAQAVKYFVRDLLVEYLTPLVAEFDTVQKALGGVQGHLKEIAKVADEALKARGFAYGATAEVTVEYFPTRVYEDYTLPAGEYTALIVRLGKGEGDNWWCVVYPPLCFASPSGEQVIYKSKIKEIIDKFHAK